MSDPKKTDDIRHARLSFVMFVVPINFAGTSQSVRIQKEGNPTGSANVVDSITPAKLEFDGQAIPTDKGQRADGLLLKKRIHDRVSNRYIQAQAFVGFSNVAEVGYGE